MCDCQRRIEQRMCGIDAELRELQTKLEIANHEKAFRELTEIEKHARLKVYLSILKRSHAREELRKFLNPVIA